MFSYVIGFANYKMVSLRSAPNDSSKQVNDGISKGKIYKQVQMDTNGISTKELPPPSNRVNTSNGRPELCSSEGRAAPSVALT